MTDKAHTYQMGPFCYRTAVALPELPRTPALEGPVIDIRVGEVPSALSQPQLATEHCQVRADEFLLRIPGVAAYYVRQGVQVVIAPEPGAAQLDVRAYLLSNVFAVLCHQRGLLPLHASSVRMPRGVVAFLGVSGAGKSSLAAFLARRGYPVVSDDICLIDPDAAIDKRVLPVAPWLKLWRTTLTALGEQPDPHMRTFTDDDKYRMRQQYDSTPLPLTEIVVLGRGDGPRTTVGAEFQRLSPVRAVQSMLEFTYQAWLVHGTGQTPRYFELCGRALEGARAYRMTRPWGFDSMETTLDAVETHLG